MKTKKILPAMVFLICFHTITKAQTLNSQIKKSAVEIGNTFTDIPNERYLYLDQVAFLLYKYSKDNSKINVLFIDQENEDLSQLAMIWLRSGLLYYGHSKNYNIESAGITTGIKPLSNIDSLKQYGFKIQNRNKNLQKIKIRYGSGSWMIYPKLLSSLNLEEEKVFKIYLESGIRPKQEANSIQLLFTNKNTIPREILYIATRINNLFETEE